MYCSYIDLLEAVDSDGEEVSPSEVSLNRSFATKELNNVQVLMDPYQQLLIDNNEVEYVEKELDWYLGTCEKSVYSKTLKDLAKDLIGCVNRAGPNSNYGEMCLRLKNHNGIT